MATATAGSTVPTRATRSAGTSSSSVLTVRGVGDDPAEQHHGGSGGVGHCRGHETGGQRLGARQRLAGAGQGSDERRPPVSRPRRPRQSRFAVRSGGTDGRDRASRCAARAARRTLVRSLVSRSRAALKT